jgi:hypothetical protein
MRNSAHEQAVLGRLSEFKKSPGIGASLLGPEMISFFKQSVSKRHTKLSRIAECWGVLIP